MNKTIGAVILFGVFISSPLHSEVKKPVVPAPVLAPSAPVPSYKTYTFYASRYRDPFIPLIGGEARGTDERPPQIQGLVVKGIVQDAKGRMALLTSGVSSYILRGGRLYDVRNRMVKKISGVIKAESVILIGSDRTVRELRINKPVL